MRRKILYLLIGLQSLLGIAMAASNKDNSSYLDSLYTQIQKLPHNANRLKLWDDLVLAAQPTPQFQKYAQEMYNEALSQRNDFYACYSAHYILIYYYNNDQTDNIIHWANYLKILAEKTKNWAIYFNSQKLLINTYIYESKFEYAIDEALKMEKKALTMNQAEGQMIAYDCMAKAYHETNRWKLEGETLMKAYDLFPKVNYFNAKMSILYQLFKFSFSRHEYGNLKKYLDQSNVLIEEAIEKHPEMKSAYDVYYLYTHAYYIRYWTQVGKPDMAKKHIVVAQKHITPSSYAPQHVLYNEAIVEYYYSIKKNETALAIVDTLIILTNKEEFPKADYVLQLTRKADILQSMGQYKEALSYYSEANRLQDSIRIAVSDKQLEEIKEMCHLNQLIWEETKLQNRTGMIILYTLSILLLVCAGYMFRINQIRKALKISQKATRQATRQTEEANEMKNRFLSNMSHAIRVPLNSVVGFSQLMVANTDLSEESRNEYANIIQENTTRLMRLVNNVLDLSRLEANMMKYQMTDYDIVQLSRDAIGSAAMQNPTLQTTFNCHIKEYVLHIDINRMMQIIVSTLTCPIPFFNEERNMIFTLEKNGEMLCFQITNCPLAENTYLTHGADIRNNINRLFIEHFGGTYQVIPDTVEGSTILFTYPIS